MTIREDVHERGGVALASQILACGYTPHTVKKAVVAGLVTRPRRGWLALPNADPQLLFAVRHGVILSCITQAKRLGLWVLNHDRPHVAVPKRGRTVSVPDGVVHWRRALVPRPPEMLADHIENVLDCVASCQPHNTALAIWDSALQQGLTDYRALSTLPLRGRANALLGECSPFADSGLETMFRTRLKWLRVRIHAQTWIHGHLVDFLIGECLVVQIDGATHTGPQRSKDIRHDAELLQLGYRVIRLSYAQVVHQWPETQDVICGAIARGLHLFD